jgi:exoribonuclease-2
MGDCYRLGIHIADVASFIPKDDPLDQAASQRGSSIYTPDRKIPMLPPELAEGRFSLKAGEIRPAISTLVRISHGGEILGYEIVASMIRVRHQLTYYEINMISDENQAVVLLRDIALSFRRTRLEAGAVQITLPEIHIWIDEDGGITINRINRESPGRMLVAELMIMANWLMARFLKANQMPGVFRSQPAPVKRLYQGEEGTVFQNIMQRRLLSRFVLSAKPEAHHGLGLDAYITATSPIRKYFDLVTQRQVRAALNLETPYSQSQIEKVIAAMTEPMSRVSLIQRNRQRYWLLKYLEKRVGQKEEAMVLGKRRSGYQVLLTDYMLEWDLTTPISLELQPEQIIDVSVSHADARNEQLTLSLV